MPDLELAKEKFERGRNCALKINFLRHAHKAQFDPHVGGKISQSGLSEKGKLASRELGNNIPSENVSEIHSSEFDRNKETAEGITYGSFEREKKTQIMTTRVKGILNAPHFSSDFIKKEYNPRFNPKPENYDSLDPDEQEKVVEEIEEPAVEYWLSLWDKKYDYETESAEEVAQRVAYYLTEEAKSINEMLSGTEDELIAINHKTVTEPILLACLKPPIKNLNEIGGSLFLLEGWSIDIKTDPEGKKTYKVSARNKEYELDWKKVEELANFYREKQKKKQEKG
ncbi:MAG: histidine phosphatase family protein [Candidatus Moranbacteria bacterium]|nr:histidine phosphatase family protein [Candidatus Moranbacteria bacterium]